MKAIARINNWIRSVYFALILFLLSICGVVFIFNSTSPADLGATGMLFAFGAFYVFFFAALLLLLHVLQTFFMRRQVKVKEKADTAQKQISIGKYYGAAATLAFAPVILIALRSIGQLDIMSTGLVAIFEVVAIFYILKR